MKTLRNYLISGLILLLNLPPGYSQSLDRPLTPEERQWVDHTLRRMSTEQKVGQLLAPAISPGKGQANDSLVTLVASWIRDYHIGHVYIASSKMDPVKTARLLNALQQQSEVPLLVHTDLECGPGSRFDGGTVFPPLMGVGQSRSEALAYEMAAITAREARAMGFHLINSPVLDVNIHPGNPVICTRSFGDRPELVATLSQAFVRGLNDHHLIGAAKHFPGHGDVAIDSHSKLPTIEASRSRLDSVEFYPYRQVIPAGLMGVMTAHISLPTLDSTPDLPATMSRPILTDILRKEFGFEGLIITDAFDMSAILESGTFEESAVRSLLAGNDIVLLWTDPRFETVFPYMRQAVREGRITESRLDASVRRILEMKARLGLSHQKLVDVEAIPRRVGTPEHQQRADRLFEQAVVLVKNEGNKLPLPAHDQTIAVFSVNDDPHHRDIGKTFVDEVKRRGKVIAESYLDPESSEEELARARTEAQSADVVVVGLFARVFARRGSSSLIHGSIIDFLQEVSRGDTPVVVSFGSPYLITHFPRVDGYLISTEPSWDFYGYSRYRPGQVAAAKALFGEIAITGKLAVSIPGLFPFGHGLRYPSAPGK